MSDYRIFVGAFPGGALAERIQALRVAHDPITAHSTPPHVTLAGTYWRIGPATPAHEAETIARLAAVCAQLPSFALELGGVETFYPQNHVIYLGVKADAILLATRQALVRVLGADKHGADFMPHLTLTMRLGAAATLSLWQALRAGEWHTQRWRAPIAQLQLMQRGSADSVWREIARLPLAMQNS